MKIFLTCKYEKGPIKTAEKKWQHRFSHYKTTGIFSDAKGQLTPQSVVETRTISYSSELSCMSLLPARMKRIGSKTAVKKWQHRFSHYNHMGAICFHGHQSSIRSDPKPFAAFPPSQWCFRLNLILINRWSQRYSCLKV